MKYQIIQSLLVLCIPTLFLNASDLSTISENISSEAYIGQNLFKKKLKRKCGFTAARFAQTHTKKEWKTIKDEGNFRIEVYKICPDTAEVLRDEWIEPLYEFSKTFASDSGEFPSC